MQQSDRMPARSTELIKIKRNKKFRKLNAILQAEIVKLNHIASSRQQVIEKAPIAAWGRIAAHGSIYTCGQFCLYLYTSIHLWMDKILSYMQNTIGILDKRTLCRSECETQNAALIAFGSAASQRECAQVQHEIKFLLFSRIYI